MSCCKYDQNKLIGVVRGTLMPEIFVRLHPGVWRQKIFITGIEFNKKDGSKALYPIHPSNLLIQDLATDKRRTDKKKQGEKK